MSKKWKTIGSNALENWNKERNGTFLNRHDKEVFRNKNILKSCKDTLKINRMQVEKPKREKVIINEDN